MKAMITLNVVMFGWLTFLAINPPDEWLERKAWGKAKRTHLCTKELVTIHNWNNDRAKEVCKGK